jgi:hypothetical protein
MNQKIQDELNTKISIENAIYALQVIVQYNF